MCTLNCPEEVELAETLLRLHPWAGMVRYARCGGEAMAIAVRIARARTGRDKIAFCGYHGWHDWYLAANLADDRNLDGHLLPGLEPAGVPRGLTGTSIPFRYNHPEEVEGLLASMGNTVAAVVMEPVRDHEPAPGFLARVQAAAREAGAVLIIDEVSAGFRLNTGGAHLIYDLAPDIAVYAKAMGNGYPMAAVVGTGEVMEAAQESFISSTYWTERIGPTAALATIEKYERERVPDHLVACGKTIQQCWRSAARESGLEIEAGGIPPLSHFSFVCTEPLPVQTLFTQEMLERGYLAGKSFYSSFAHQDGHIAGYAEAVRDVFEIVASALDRGTVMTKLKGPVAHSGFRRLT
jgi:glutamate-1-semialdehyde aminotransferase